MILFPTRLDEAVGADHLVRLFDDILSRLDWARWEANYELRRGQPPIHPRILASVILYGLLNRIRSSRALEEALQVRLDFCWLVEGRSIDHSTLSEFRRQHADALKDTFVQVGMVARELGLEEHQCEVIRHAAPMHDIGKIGISDKVLLKEGQLSDTEWRIMQNHCRIGHEILKGSPSHYLKSGATIALGHHERFDGKGYPDGISGSAIPIEARVVTVADVFDALQSDRPYRKGWSLDRTLDYMRRQRGEQFDPDCIDAFLRQLDSVLSIKTRFSDEAGVIDTLP